VAAVDAIKLRNNIFFATRTIHVYSVSCSLPERSQPPASDNCATCGHLGIAFSTDTSFGNRYSFPAEPKSTRISFRPKFSMSLTNVPCRGKRTPVLGERITLVVLSESPVFIPTNVRAGCVPGALVRFFVGFQDGRKMRLVKSVERIDEKVGLDYLSFCDGFPHDAACFALSIPSI